MKYIENASNVRTLEDLVYYLDMQDGYPYAIANYYIDQSYKRYIPEVAGYVNCIILMQQIETMKKYGYAIDSFYLENYLGPTKHLATEDRIISFFKNCKDSMHIESKRQYLFAGEIFCFCSELLDCIEKFLIENREKSISKEDVFNIIEKFISKDFEEEYNFKISSSEPDNYTVLYNHLINNDIIVYQKDPEQVLENIPYTKKMKIKKNIEETIKL